MATPVDLYSVLLEHSPAVMMQGPRAGQEAVCCRCDITWRSQEGHATHVAQAVAKKAEDADHDDS